jgi:hypothetical protein
VTSWQGTGKSLTFFTVFVNQLSRNTLAIKQYIISLSFRCLRPVKNGEHIYVTKKNILFSVVVNEFETAAMECTAQGSPVPR